MFWSSSPHIQILGNPPHYTDQDINAVQMVIDYNEPEGEGVHLSELSILAEFRLSDDRIV